MLSSIIGLLIVIFSVIICHAIAKRRGANTLFWAIMGAIFGPLAIPFSFFSRPRRISGDSD